MGHRGGWRERARVRPPMRQISALILLAVVIGLTLASTAMAYRQPTGEERGQIQAATDRQVPDQAGPLKDVRVSSNGRWATASIQALVAPGQLQPAPGIYRLASSPIWNLVYSRSEICVGAVTSNFGMPRSIGLNLGLTLCSRNQAPHPPRRHAHWRKCGSQPNRGAGWYYVRALRLHCQKARGLAKRFFHKSGIVVGVTYIQGFICQANPAGIESLNVACRRERGNRVQKVRFLVGA